MTNAIHKIPTVFAFEVSWNNTLFLILVVKLPSFLNFWAIYTLFELPEVIKWKKLKS